MTDETSSCVGQKAWLGTVAELEPKRAYRSTEGTQGEIRVVRPSDRIRVTRKPVGALAASTVQIALTASGPIKTAVIFHHKKLQSPEEREAMRTRWRAVSEELTGLIETSPS